MELKELRINLVNHGGIKIFHGETDEEIAEKLLNYVMSSNVKIDLFNTKETALKFTKENAYSIGNGAQTFRLGSKNKDGKKGNRNYIAAASTAFNVAVGNVADDDEIKRRAKVCERCSFRKSGEPNCRACSASSRLTTATNLIRRFIGKAPTIPDSLNERFCGFCDCSLSLLVQMKEIEAKGETPLVNQQRPDFCWLKIKK